jgi:hypothetical protein
MVDGKMEKPLHEPLFFQSSILNPQSSGSKERLRCPFESCAWLMLQHEVKHEQGRNKEKHCQG